MGLEVDGARALPRRGRGPDVEMSTAMGGDKHGFRARHPLHTGHTCLVYGTLIKEREREREGFVCVSQSVYVCVLVIQSLFSLSLEINF